MDNRNSGQGLIRGFVLLCIGCILVAIGLSLGGKTIREFKFWPWDSDHFHFNWEFGDDDGDSCISPVEICEGPIPADIRNLTVDLKFSSLEIRRGSAPEYRATDFRENTLQVMVEGDTLIIEETDWQGSRNFGDPHMKSHLEIILPEKAALGAATVSIGAGALTMTDVAAEYLSIESGAGSIKGTGLNADRVSLKTGAGSLDFSGCSFGNTVIQTGAGRVQYDGSLMSHTEISTGAGSVELDLDGSEDEYRIDFTRGIGSVRIGRSSYNGLGSGTAGNLDAGRRLDITSGVGAVRIRFKD